MFFDDEECRVRITELPVGVWTKDYKAFLEKLLAGEDKPRVSSAAAKKPAAKAKKAAAGGAGTGDAASVASITVVKVLKDYQEHYNDVDVEFVLTLEPDYYYEAKLFPAEFEKKFRLTKSHALTNMVAFNTEGRLQRFASPGEILETFYGTRLAGYVARKANELARMDAEIVELDARVRFVRAVVTGTLVVANAEDEALLAGLVALGLPPLSLTPGSSADLRGYEYLLRMRVDRLKAKAVLELEEELAQVRVARDTLAAKRPEDLWLVDLDVFSEAYDVFAAARLAARSQVGSAKPVTKKAVAKKTVAKKAVA